MSSETQVILAKQKDWPQWISIMRQRSEDADIWDLVNPDQPTRPIGRQKPIAPEPPHDEEDKEAFERYKRRREIYKHTLALYTEQKTALSGILQLIHKTISAENAIYIRSCEAHPWELLTKLKLELAPSDRARRLTLKKDYQRLCKGPRNHQDVQKWTTEWVVTLEEAKQVDLEEARESRAVEDFLTAITNVAPHFATTYIMKIESEEVVTMKQVIEHFRRHESERHLHTEKGSHSAFQSSGTYRGRPPNHSPNRSPVNLPRCLCGTKHWYSDCPYLNQDVRPGNWKADRSIQDKVRDRLKDPTTKSTVDRSIQRKRDIEGQDSEKQSQDRTTTNHSSNTGSNHESKEPIGTFTAISTYHTKARLSPLRESWILDSGADAHVCNDTMKGRFTISRVADPDEKVTAGTDMKIMAYGTVKIYVQGEYDQEVIVLEDVAYIPSFPTNLVSLHKAQLKGVYWDHQRGYLRKPNGDLMCKVGQYGGHYLLEDNTNQDEPSSPHVFHAIQSASGRKWHRMLAHASPEAVTHLTSATEGVKITNEDPAPTTTNCETCALSKAHRIISRRSESSEPSTRPFQRVSFDLIQFESAYNGHQWVSHLACDFTDFNMVYTHRSKTESPGILLEAIAQIRTRYKQDVVYIRSDGETSLDKAFHDQLLSKGITFEPSAPDTPAQNGHAERKGRMITTKARAIRIEGNIPVTMWPEAIQTAGYLANRTPMRKHRWKTPFEMVTKGKPRLNHLHPFGCKAYSLIKHIPRLQKLVERANVGYLTGYDSTNIYRIWVPSKNKVIRTRDVTFNDMEYYNPSSIDLYQLINEPFTRVLSIPDPESSHIPEEESESDTASQSSEGSIIYVESIEPNPKEVSTTMVDRPNQARTPVSMRNDREDTDSSNVRTPFEPVRTEPIAPRSPQSIQLEAPMTASRSQEVSAELDQGNIVDLPRTRRPTRREIHMAQVSQAPYTLQAYHASFGAYQANTKAPIVGNQSHHRDKMPIEPESYKDMLKHPHTEGFKQAISTELAALRKKDTWKEVPYDVAARSNARTIPTRWVFKYKFDDQGLLVKYKARLCARGDLQKTEADTYAATLAARIFRALMAVTAAFDLEVRQYDAVNAFANSPIDETTFCNLPEGWNGKKNIVLELQKALYGLKQSPALWYKHLSNTLSSLGLETVTGVECLCMNSHMMVFFFVDDIAVIYFKDQEKHVDEFQRRLFEKYEMKYIGELQWFLGIQIIRDRQNRKLWLSQESYIDKITTKFNVVTTGRRIKTPLPNEIIKKAEIEATKESINIYQQHIGSINFAAVTTRPDIAYAISILSSHLRNPSDRHRALAERLLQYLASTKTLSIEYGGSLPIGDIENTRSVFQASSDASFADDADTRRSTQGYAFTLYNGPIDWKSTKQRSVTTSTTEAELMALSNTCKETIWWERFFQSIDFNMGTKVKVQCDNMQTIRLLTTESPRLHTKVRHVDIHHHWLRQEIRKANVIIEWTPSARVMADGFTKALPDQKHQEFLQLLHLRTIPKHDRDAKRHDPCLSSSNSTRHDHEGGVLNGETDGPSG